MKILQDVSALSALVGQHLGSSGFVTVDQAAIDAFAGATGDHQWIHVDPARAARELPGGRTIAHGYLTLSLIPRLAAQVYAVAGQPTALNYGLNRVRFLQPVPSGARVRLHLAVAGCDSLDTGMRLTMANTIELEGSDKPALLAETIVFFPRPAPRRDPP
jgi:acyl dehydratase